MKTTIIQQLKKEWKNYVLQWNKQWKDENRTRMKK
jgi:hypothetical protein